MLKELFQSAFYAGLVGCVLVAFYLMGAASMTEEEEEVVWGCFSFDERKFATTEEEILRTDSFLYATTPNAEGKWVNVYVLRDSIKGCMELPQ